jgi:hypothetical protein
MGAAAAAVARMLFLGAAKPRQTWQPLMSALRRFGTDNELYQCSSARQYAKSSRHSPTMPASGQPQVIDNLAARRQTGVRDGYDPPFTGLKVYNRKTPRQQLVGHERVEVWTMACVHASRIVLLLHATCYIYFSADQLGIHTA